MSDKEKDLEMEDVEEAVAADASAQEQIAALQSEVEDLRRQASEASEPKKERHTGRKWAVALLILLGSILFATANVTMWVRGVILDTDDWVSTVGPISQNEVIVDAVSLYVVAGLFDAVEASQLVQEVLPQDFAFLSGAATSVLEKLARDVVSTVIASNEFNAIWRAVNRTAHETIITVLSGKGNVAYMREGQLVLDLSDVFEYIQQTLGLERLDQLVPDDWGRFVLFESSQVAAIQQVLGLVDTLGILMPILALVAFAAAWFTSLWRRKTLLWIGVAAAITMAVTLLLLAMTKPFVLASIAAPLVRIVAGELWTVVLRLLFIQTWILLIVGVLIAIGAWLAGPHPRAVAIRTGVRRWVEGLRKPKEGQV